MDWVVGEIGEYTADGQKEIQQAHARKPSGGLGSNRRGALSYKDVFAEQNLFGATFRRVRRGLRLAEWADAFRILLAARRRGGSGRNNPSGGASCNWRRGRSRELDLEAGGDRNPCWL